VNARSPSERTGLRDLLTSQRASSAAQIEALTRDLGGIIEASTSVATDDEHDPEGATIAFERAQVSRPAARTCIGCASVRRR
jgi:hypothetical protein